MYTSQNQRVCWQGDKSLCCTSSEWSNCHELKLHMYQWVITNSIIWIVFTHTNFQRVVELNGLHMYHDRNESSRTLLSKSHLHLLDYLLRSNKSNINQNTNFQWVVETNWLHLYCISIHKLHHLNTTHSTCRESQVKCVMMTHSSRMPLSHHELHHLITTYLITTHSTRRESQVNLEPNKEGIKRTINVYHQIVWKQQSVNICTTQYLILSLSTIKESPHRLC